MSETYTVLNCPNHRHATCGWGVVFEEMTVFQFTSQKNVYLQKSMTKKINVTLASVISRGISFLTNTIVIHIQDIQMLTLKLNSRRHVMQIRVHLNSFPEKKNHVIDSISVCV